mgnify:CR=1 FL=1
MGEGMIKVIGIFIVALYILTVTVSVCLVLLKWSKRPKKLKLIKGGKNGTSL